MTNFKIYYSFDFILYKAIADSNNSIKMRGKFMYQKKLIKYNSSLMNKKRNFKND